MRCPGNFFHINPSYYRDDKLEKREWPPINEILEFRSKVKTLVLSTIDDLRLDDNSLINDVHPFWAFIMGIEHEKIHLETTTVLIRLLPL
jgi:hypothetical protein